MRYVVIGPCWLWGVIALPQVTDAGFELFADVMLFAFGGIIVISWAVYSQVVPGIFRAPLVRWAWMSVPVLGAGIFFLSITHEDLVGRVRLSDSELRQYAESARQNPNSPRGPRRIGSFEVKETVASEKQVMLHTTSGFMTSSGIVYRPDGSRPESHDSLRHLSNCEHLYGPWWRFDEMQD